MRLAFLAALTILLSATAAPGQPIDTPRDTSSSRHTLSTPSSPTLAAVVENHRAKASDVPSLDDPPPHLSERAGLLYGLVFPGAGQFYAARPVKGFAVFGVALASTVMVLTSCDDSEPVAPRCGGGLGIGAASFLASWLYGMASAPADVREHNLSLGPPYTLTPYTDPARRQVGLALSLRM